MVIDWKLLKWLAVTPVIIAPNILPCSNHACLKGGCPLSQEKICVNCTIQTVQTSVSTKQKDGYQVV